MIKFQSVFTVAILLLSTLVYSQKTPVTLDDIWGSTKLFAKSTGSFSTMKDGEHYTNIAGGYLIKYDFKSGKAVDTITTITYISAPDTIKFSSYTFSPDEKQILFSANDEAIYRHSSKSDYYLMNTDNGNVKKISGNGKMMYCRFSPAGNQLAFVRDNNLYLLNTENNTETAVTTDGKRNEIINGATDWVYEEEFTMDIAFSWSPDGNRIAYYRFDESRVKEFTLLYYGDLYPKEERYKYPKAGEENSKVEIFVYDVINKKNIKMDTGKDREYIPRIKWTENPQVLSVQRSNRHQNILELIFCDAATGNSKVIIKEQNDSFIEVTDDLTFLPGNKQFIWTSTRDGHNHIYLYTIEGKLVKKLTSGNYDVTNFYGYDEKSSTCFYQSTEKSPTERHIYAVNLDGKKRAINEESGVHKAVFSKGYNYYALTKSAYTTPPVTTLHDRTGKVLRVLEDNKSLKSELEKLMLSKSEPITVKNGEWLLNGYMIKPADFKEGQKYPVLIYVYGGPGKQTVMNEWEGTNHLWHQMLAQKGYIIVSVDNRGTPGRGYRFSSSIYRNMGKYETEDQIAVAKYLQSLPYVNAERIGVWGWSYGGYMTSLLMTKSEGLFKAGIAVAPVTNWRYYDNIYTERYLQTPQENPKGYDDNSPINFAKNLNGKFLLVHGSGDDNVHYQNTMDFINALVKNNRQFDLMIYPNRAHGISGGGARLHLFTKMTDFILENL